MPLMLPLISLALLGQAAVAPARFQAWNPDPALSFELPAGPRFVRSSAKVDGALHLFQDREHPASMILISFFPGTTLEKQLKSGHEELLRLVPNKRVEPVTSQVFSGIFAKIGLKFAAFSYPSGPKTGGAGSICDSAAVHWQTAGGVWTLSANGNIGDAQAIQAVLEGFLKQSKLADLNRPAKLTSKN